MGKRLAVLAILSVVGAIGVAQEKQEGTIPTATQWTLDAAGPSQGAPSGRCFSSIARIPRRRELAS